MGLIIDTSGLLGFYPFLDTTLSRTKASTPTLDTTLSLALSHQGRGEYMLKGRGDWGWGLGIDYRFSVLMN